MKITVLIILFAALFFQCDQQTKSEMKDHEKDECCTPESSKSSSNISEITCPECGHTEVEELPTDVCLIKYNCKSCEAELSPKESDCCVFCTYGTHKCPSMQEVE